MKCCIAGTVRTCGKYLLKIFNNMENTSLTVIEKYSQATIIKASELLKQGKLVSFPTETVYGLGANALDVEACNLIFTTKGRPLTDPLIVHVHSLDYGLSLIDQSDVKVI